MLMDCSKCTKLTLDYVNSASGLDLHRFHWLSSDSEIGSISYGWNHLVDVNEYDSDDESTPNLLHWTLGGPWFKDQRTMGGTLAAEWFSARDESMKLWD